MSSPFQKSFSDKSPITSSPFKAGGYGSGVDGMRYVSPKQPVSKPVAKPGRAKVKPVSTLTPEGINIPDPVIEVSLPNLGDIKEVRILDKMIPGKEVERKATTPAEIAAYKKYLADVKSGKIKRNTKYDSKTIYQNQERTGETLDGKLVGDMSEWANVGDEYEKN